MGRSSQTHPVPKGALDAALQRGMELSQDIPGVLSCGIGFKHSDRRGYGRIPKVAIKFLVLNKRPEPKKGRSRKGLIPRTVSVMHRGRRFRFPTDVEECATAEQHFRLRPDSLPQNQGFGGSPTCLLGHGADRFVLTAGHALQGIAGVKEAELVHLDPGGPIANVKTEWTCPRDALKRVLDFGIAPCVSNPPTTFASRVPWSLIKKVASAAQIDEWVRMKLTPQCVVAGAAAVQAVNFDTRFAMATTFPFDSGTEVYAPGLLLFRSIKGGFAKGDSGSAMIWNGQLLGIHVVGTPGLNTHVSFAFCADEALRWYAAATGRRLQPVQTP